MSKKTVCVLFGGQSSEHDISCISASCVIKNLDKEKYDIVPIGITKDGKWFLTSGDTDLIKTGKWKDKPLSRAIISPDASQKGILIISENKTELKKIDVVFPVLHGKNGEDGTIQGLLELAEIPYVGCGTLSSSVSMDKTFTKLVVEAAGIRQANWLVYREGDDFLEFYENVLEKLSLPCFVKPANTGSSVGISRADTKEQLKEAVELALLYDKKLLVEEFIDCREIECAVLGNNEPKASILGEIIPKTKFYDFDAKYNDASTSLVIGADLPESTTKTIRENAIKIFKALDCSGLSRVDFFVHKKTGEIYFNEINTMPGFTDISMYPKLWDACGIKYSDLLDELISLA